MSKKHDPLLGLKCFSIGGRMMETRQRCMGMTDEERRWRAQFLKDQVLSHNEPRFCPEYYKDTTNIFRRLWKTPMMKFEAFLTPLVGAEWACGIRQYVGKTAIMIGFVYIAAYYLKYNANDWTYHSIEWWRTRGRMFPDDPNWPNYKEKTPQEYADFGFSSSVLCKKIEKAPEAPPEPKRMRGEEDDDIACPAKETENEV